MDEEHPPVPGQQFPATAVILAGGTSSRMQQDKRFLPVQNKPLIQHVVDALRPHFVQTIIMAPDPECLSFLDLQVLQDLRPGAGPLAGIASALGTMKTELAFVCACDIPYPPLALIQKLYEAMPGHDCAVPQHPDGKVESLFSFFSQAMKAPAITALSRDEFGVYKLIAHSHAAYVPIGGYTLKNVNTPEDYREAAK